MYQHQVLFHISKMTAIAYAFAMLIYSTFRRLMLTIVDVPHR